MSRFLLALLIGVLLVGCGGESDSFDDASERLGELEKSNLKLQSNAAVDTDHQAVIERYTQYLDIASDPETRIRVANRIAALKLQAQTLYEDQLEESDSAAPSAKTSTSIGTNTNNDAELLEPENDPALLLAYESINDYRALLDLYPDRRDNDAVLYQLARAYVLTFQREQAIDTLETLRQQFPKSPYVLESMFRLGRLYYAIGDYSNAERAYQNVLDFSPNTHSKSKEAKLIDEIQGRKNTVKNIDESKKSTQALNKYALSAAYLQGWAVFKQQRYDDSLRIFSQMIRTHFPTPSALADAGSNQAILEDSIRIMAVIFDDQGDWTAIANFFDRQSKTPEYFEYLLYDQLATLYYQQSFYKSAASTLRAFALRHPMSPKAHTFYERLIKGYTQANFPTLKRKHMHVYTNMFGVKSDYFKQQSPQVRARVTPYLKTYLLELANFYHAWGQGSFGPNKRKRLLMAKQYYQTYLQSFERAEDAGNVHFLLAELASELGDHRLAKRHYELVAYQFVDNQHASEAAYAAILAYRAYTPSLDESMAWRRQQIASALRLSDEYPNHQYRMPVLLTSAEMLLADKHYTQANHVARRVLDTPNATLIEQQKASLVAGHAQFALKDYQQAELSLLKAKSSTLLSSNVRADLTKKIAVAIYQQGKQDEQKLNRLSKLNTASRTTAQSEPASELDPELFERTKNKLIDQAVGHWLRLDDSASHPEISPLAVYDAATLLMQQQQYARAIPILLSFRERYTRHALAKNIASKLIVAYEKTQQWQQAAQELHQICVNDSNPKRQRIACYQTAQYYEKSDNQDQAISAYKRYAHQFKRPFDVALEAHVKLDELYAAKGDDKKRRFWLGRIITLHQQAGKAQTPRSRYLTAKAAFELGEVERKKYELVPLTQPLSDSIARKSRLMTVALNRYKQAAKTGVKEFTTSSTYRIGELYRHLSHGLLTSEKPKGMDELEEEEYEFLLEDEAYPMEEAAIKVHQTNAQRSYDGVYDRWVRDSITALGILMPTHYQKPERAPLYVPDIR